MKTLVIGYGTLLLQASVGTTIGANSADEKTYRPVVIPGFKRLFNLRPTHYESSAKFSDTGIENAAMNVEPWEGGHFNGVAFEATTDEIEALDKRELYYDRVSVPVVDFSSGQSLGNGFCYMSKLDAEWIERDNEKLMPLWRDIVWARTGSAGICEAFAEDYDQTTYMADGTTLMTDVYREFLSDMSDVPLPGASA